MKLSSAAWWISCSVALFTATSLHAPKLPAGYKVKAHCLRSAGFVSRSVPEFELRNPGSKWLAAYTSFVGMLILNAAPFLLDSNEISPP